MKCGLCNKECDEFFCSKDCEREFRYLNLIGGKNDRRK